MCALSQYIDRIIFLNNLSCHGENTCIIIFNVSSDTLRWQKLLYMLREQELNKDSDFVVHHPCLFLTIYRYFKNIFWVASIFVATRMNLYYVSLHLIKSKDIHEGNNTFVYIIANKLDAEAFLVLLSFHYLSCYYSFVFIFSSISYFKYRN